MAAGGRTSVSYVSIAHAGAGFGYDGKNRPFLLLLLLDFFVFVGNPSKLA